MIGQIRMAHQTGKCVPENGGAPEFDLFQFCLLPVLMCCPLKLGGVSMACAHVLGLQVLQLAVDVVALSHFRNMSGK